MLAILRRHGIERVVAVGVVSDGLVVVLPAEQCGVETFAAVGSEVCTSTQLGVPGVWAVRSGMARSFEVIGRHGGWTVGRGAAR